MPDVVREMHAVVRAHRRGAGLHRHAAARPRSRCWPTSASTCRSRGKAPLCGNSIATDRGFLTRDMPELDDWLHYRMVDVSLGQGAGPALVPAGLLQRPQEGRRPPRARRHPGVGQELRYYRAAVFVPQPGPTSEQATAVAAELVGGDRRPRRSGCPRLGAGPRLRPRYACGRAHHGGCSSAGRAPGCDPGCRGFEPRHSPHDAAGHRREPVACGVSGRRAWMLHRPPRRAGDQDGRARVDDEEVDGGSVRVTRSTGCSGRCTTPALRRRPRGRRTRRSSPPRATPTPTTSTTPRARRSPSSGSRRRHCWRRPAAGSRNPIGGRARAGGGVRTLRVLRRADRRRPARGTAHGQDLHRVRVRPALTTCRTASAGPAR